MIMLPMSHNPSLYQFTCSFHLFSKNRETILFNHMGCISQSSVDVSHKQIKKQRVSLSDLVDQDNKLGRKGEEKANRIKRRKLWATLEFQKLRIVNFLMTRLKSLSHFFVDKEENEETEMEMEIGQPTDVKHVTHIGWDGSTTVNPVMGWENLKAPELLSFPTISLKQFDLAMSAQAREPPRPDSVPIPKPGL